MNTNSTKPSEKSRAPDNSKEEPNLESYVVHAAVMIMGTQTFGQIVDYIIEYFM